MAGMHKTISHVWLCDIACVGSELPLHLEKVNATSSHYIDIASTQSCSCGSPYTASHAIGCAAVTL